MSDHSHKKRVIPPSAHQGTRTPIQQLEYGFESLIFWSRWLQAPVYGGLILATLLYVYRFGGELYVLANDVIVGVDPVVHAPAHPGEGHSAAHAPAAKDDHGAAAKDEHGAAAGHAAPAAPATTAEKAAAAQEVDDHGRPVKKYQNGKYPLEEGEFLFRVLTLIDITMVMNLLVMVIIGGYAIFVSKLSVDDHEDHPDWLDHINANTLKIKLSTSLVGITGIHLLKSFIDVKEILKEPNGNYVLIWDVVIHFTFLLSVLALSFSERILGHHDPDGIQYEPNSDAVLESTKPKPAPAHSDHAEAAEPKPEDTQH